MRRISARELVILGLAIAAIATVVSWSVVVRIVPRTVMGTVVSTVHQAKQLH